MGTRSLVLEELGAGSDLKQNALSEALCLDRALIGIQVVTREGRSGGMQLRRSDIHGDLVGHVLLEEGPGQGRPPLDENGAHAIPRNPGPWLQPPTEINGGISRFGRWLANSWAMKEP